MRAELKNLRESINTTIIYVTHDYHEALALGERMAILHEGKIQQIGKPNDVFHNPENIICAESFGDPSINLIEGQIVSDKGDLSVQINEFKLQLPKSFVPKLHMQKNDEVVVGIRPSHIVPNKAKLDKNINIQARVYVQEIIGDEEIITTKLGNNLIKTLTKPGIPFDLDETIYLSWNSESMHLFSKETGINLMN
jgi:multiple sugar transport system ATP-binding protein